MTTYEMNKKEFERLVEKYYKEQLDFEGKATTSTVLVEEYRDQWYEPLVKLKGYLELNGSKFEVERSVSETKVKEIINFYFNNDNQRVININFNLVGNKEEFKGIKIQVEEIVKTKGMI